MSAKVINSKNQKDDAGIFAVDCVRAEFFKRREKNPQYSLRAFAKHLNVGPGRLSEILARKRRISKKMAGKIADKLMFNPEQRQKFMGSLSKGVASKNSTEGTNTLGTSYQLLEMDSFALIADWYHFAILSLMETAEYSEDPKDMAKRFGISTVEVRQAMERLERLQLIKKNNEGRFQPSYSGVTTSHNIPSAALRKGHTQILAKSTAAIEEFDVEERDITSIIFASDPQKLAGAKNMIKKFRRDLCAYMEKGKKSEVYVLAVQLIPLTNLKHRRSSVK